MFVFVGRCSCSSHPLLSTMLNVSCFSFTVFIYLQDYSCFQFMSQNAVNNFSVNANLDRPTLCLSKTLQIPLGCRFVPSSEDEA